MTGPEAKAKLDSTLSYMAYERGHSAGKAEVEMIEESLRHDFKWLYEFLDELTGPLAR